MGRLIMPTFTLLACTITLLLRTVLHELAGFVLL